MIDFDNTWIDYDAFCHDFDRQMRARKKDWDAINSFINDMVEDRESRIVLHRKINNLKKICREKQQKMQSVTNPAPAAVSPMPIENKSVLNLKRDIQRFEMEDPKCIKVTELTQLAQAVEKLSISKEEKIKLLTKIDKLYINRQSAKRLNGKSKGYCRNYKIKNNMASEETKGYGSRCIGHSRSAYKFTGL